jgi:hypothetical protein
MDEATVQAGGQAQWQSQAREQAGLSGAKEEIDATNLHIDSTLSFLRAGQRGVRVLPIESNGGEQRNGKTKRKMKRKKNNGAPPEKEKSKV